MCLLPLRPSHGKDDRRIKSTVDICISFQMLKKFIFYLYEYNFVVSRFLPLHKLLSDYHTNITSLRCVVCINHVLVYSSSTLRSWFLWASCTLFSLSSVQQFTFVHKKLNNGVISDCVAPWSTWNSLPHGSLPPTIFMHYTIKPGVLVVDRTV